MSAATVATAAKPRDWLAGARPRTLPVAVVPVAVGTGVAQAVGHVIWWRSVLALVVSLAVQIGTNYANDYSDGIRGTDAVRVGPLRLVAGGVASPAAVKRAAFASFAIAAIAGLVLALATSLWLLGVGAACIAAGWFYTGGPRPYGYAGLGEIFVFVFFGLVAVAGTTFVNVGHVSGLALLAGVPVGLLAVALLVVNNLRDLENDARAGKRTLAVRLGERRTRLAFEACIVVAFAVAWATAFWRLGALLGVVAAVFAVGPVRLVHRRASDRALIEVLGMTGRLGLVFGLLFALGLAW